MNDTREALHAAVEDLFSGKDKGEFLRKWTNALTNIEALLMSLPESHERQMAIDRMTECAYWTSLIITDAQVMDRQTARKTVRRMRAD